MPDPILRVSVFLYRQLRRNEVGGKGGWRSPRNPCPAEVYLSGNGSPSGTPASVLWLRFPVTNPTTLNPTSSDTYCESCSRISPETLHLRQRFSTRAVLPCLLPEGIWQCLETLCVGTTWRDGTSFWWLESRDAPSTPCEKPRFNIQDYSVKVKKPCLKEKAALHPP